MIVNGWYRYSMINTPKQATSKPEGQERFIRGLVKQRRFEGEVSKNKKTNYQKSRPK